MYMYACLSVCMYVYHSVQEPSDIHQGVESPEPGVQMVVLPCGCWELSHGPLQAQQVFLTPKGLSAVLLTHFSLLFSLPIFLFRPG